MLWKIIIDLCVWVYVCVCACRLPYDDGDQRVCGSGGDQCACPTIYQLSFCDYIEIQNSLGYLFKADLYSSSFNIFLKLIEPLIFTI